MKKFYITSLFYILLSLTLVFYCFLKFGEVKFGVITLLFMILRIVLANGLGVGVVTITKSWTFSDMNLKEAMYTSLLFISIFSAWMGYFRMIFILDKSVLDNNNLNIFLVLMILTMFSIALDIIYFLIKKNKKNPHFLRNESDV